MTITIDLPPKAEKLLTERAAQEGSLKEEVASRVLIEALDWEATDFQEAVEGIRKGLEDCEAGRLKPAEEVLAKLDVALKAARK